MQLNSVITSSRGPNKLCRVALRKVCAKSEGKHISIQNTSLQVYTLC